MIARVIILSTIAASLLCGGCDQGDSAESRESAPTLSVEMQREWAASLRADGLHEQALAIYEDLLDDGHGIESNTVIGLSVLIADIHIEKRRYEEALRSLYRAALFEPAGEQARRIDEKKILCFERLGRGAAADRLLDKASTLGGEKGTATTDGDVVIAEIGGEKITRAQLDALIAATPPELRARLEEDAAQRRKVLETYVATRVLERKAVKLEYDDDPAVRTAMEAASREILVRKLLAEEIREKVSLTEDDAKLFYEAHRDEFREPLAFEIAHILVKDGVKETALRERLAAEEWDEVAAVMSQDASTADAGGRIEAPVIEGRNHPVFTSVADVVEAIGDTPVGQIAARSVATTKGRHVLKVLRREGGRQLPYDEVSEQAMRLLRARRESAAVEEVMQQALTGSDVKIHGEKL